MNRKATIAFDDLKEKRSIEFLGKNWKRLKGGDKDSVMFVYRTFMLQVDRYNTVDEPFEVQLVQDWKRAEKHMLPTSIQDVFGQTINAALRELKTKTMQIAALVRRK